MTPHRSPTPWIIAALATLTLATFWPVLHMGFINYDDPDYITRNAQVQRGLTIDGARWAVTTGQAGNWHPLTWLSLMLDWQISGGKPCVFHLTNLLLHGTNAILLFALFNTMTGSRWRSAIVAAVFAIHPLRVESVAWAAERKDVLCYFFGLLTLLAYIHHVRRPSAWRYVAVVAAFAMCLLSKSMLVTLPCLLLLLDFWPLGRIKEFQAHIGVQSPFPARPAAWLVLEKLPLLAMAAGTSWMTFHMQSVGNAVTEFDRLALSTRLANATLAYARYAGKLAFPRDLVVFYPYVTHWHPWLVACSAAALLAATALVTWQLRHRPWLFVGWFWFVGLLVPVIGLIQSGLQSIADRWTYLSTTGLVIMLIWSIPSRWMTTAAARRVVGGASLGLLLTLAVLTRGQLQYWKDSITLFRHAVEATDDNWLAHGVLGSAFLAETRYADAESAFRSAIKAKPDFFEGYCNLGNALAAQRLFAQAIEQFQIAARLQPDRPEPHYNIGSVLLADPSKTELAAEEFQRAVTLRPSYAAAHIELARAFLKLNQPQNALTSLRTAIAVDPDNAEARYRLGLALASAGRHGDANEAYRAAVAINPNSTDFRNALAWSLATAPGATMNGGREAMDVISVAIESAKGNPDPNLLDTLAAALARAGRMADAAAAADRAVEAARSRGMIAMSQDFASRAALYRMGIPYTQGTTTPP